MEFIDIVARWPGSTHDSYIFNNCYRKAMFEQGRYDNAVLVGDGEYASKSYMMTPLDRCNTAAEHLYNESRFGQGILLSDCSEYGKDVSQLRLLDYESV